jgi:hypothetical protein
MNNFCGSTLCRAVLVLRTIPPLTNLSKGEIRQSNFEPSSYIRGVVKHYIPGWRRFTIDVISTLWIFYDKLNKPGQRVDLSQNCERLPTWTEWLETNGFENQDYTRFHKFVKGGNQDYISFDKIVERGTGFSQNCGYLI